MRWSVRRQMGTGASQIGITLPAQLRRTIAKCAFSAVAVVQTASSFVVVVVQTRTRMTQRPAETSLKRPGTRRLVQGAKCCLGQQQGGTAGALTTPCRLKRKSAFRKESATVLARITHTRNPVAAFETWEDFRGTNSSATLASISVPMLPEAR